MPGPPLDQVEGAEGRDRQGQAALDRVGDRAVAGDQDQQGEADHGEQELCQRLGHQIDEHAGARERAGDVALRQEARADEVAADGGNGQQRVDALTDEAEGHAVGELGRGPRKDHVPAEPRPGDGHDAGEHHQGGAPAGAHDGGRHILQSGGHEQADDRAQTGDRGQGREALHCRLSSSQKA